jgi:hypothetical protein
VRNEKGASMIQVDITSQISLGYVAFIESAKSLKPSFIAYSKFKSRLFGSDPRFSPFGSSIAKGVPKSLTRLTKTSIALPADDIHNNEDQTAILLENSVTARLH